MKRVATIFFAASAASLGWAAERERPAVAITRPAEPIPPCLPYKLPLVAPPEGVDFKLSLKTPPAGVDYKLLIRDPCRDRLSAPAHLFPGAPPRVGTQPRWRFPSLDSERMGEAGRLWKH